MMQLTEIACALKPELRVRTLQGRPVTVGERQIVPVARAIYLAIGRRGGPVAAGVAWNRPVAVLDVYAGQTRRVPIPDPTRRLTLALAASGLLLALMARYLRARRESEARSV